MTDATPGMVEMARRFALEAWPHDVPITEPLRRYMESAALAAIIETQRLDAAEAERVINKMRGSGESDLRTARHLVCAAIRAGQHYGKDEG